MICEAGESRINTTGIRNTVRASQMPTKIPKIKNPERNHRACLRASSNLFCPSELPTIIRTQVKITGKIKKNIFAIVQPAAMPATTSAPPRLLYSAATIVSVPTHEISEANTKPSFLTICMNNFHRTFQSDNIRT